MKPKATLSPTGKGPATKGGRGKLTAREQAHIDLRRTRADALDLAGATIREIADALEVGVATIHEDLKHARAARAEEFKEVRASALDTELARLERLRSRWVQAGEQGSVQAAQLLLAIHDRKVRLLGLGDETMRVELAPAMVSPRQTLERKLKVIEATGVVKAS